MRRWRILFVFGAVLTLTAACGTPSEVPRLSNGQPDFSGAWQSLTPANWNILTHGATAGPPEYGALLAGPPGTGIVEGDEIPYLPAAAAQRERNFENRWSEDPEVKCYMPGIPRANYMPYPFSDLSFRRAHVVRLSVRGRGANHQPERPSAFVDRQLDGLVERAVGR